MSEHTPGPWRISPVAGWWCVRGSNDHRVLGISTGTPADARLIAAAPDMLALLEEIYDNPALLSDYPSIFNAAKALIAKAKGEA